MACSVFAQAQTSTYSETFKTSSYLQVTFHLKSVLILSPMKVYWRLTYNTSVKVIRSAVTTSVLFAVI
jgi:hypothetical protein